MFSSILLFVLLSFVNAQTNSIHACAFTASDGTKFDLDALVRFDTNKTWIFSDSHKVTWEFNFCNPVSYCNGHTDSAVCMRPANKTALSFGTYSSIEWEKDAQGNPLITYSGGDLCPQKSKESLKANFRMICQPNMPKDSVLVSGVKINGCEVLFTMSSPNACPQSLPSESQSLNHGVVFGLFWLAFFTFFCCTLCLCWAGYYQRRKRFQHKVEQDFIQYSDDTFNQPIENEEMVPMVYVPQQPSPSAPQLQFPQTQFITPIYYFPSSISQSPMDHRVAQILTDEQVAKALHEQLNKEQ